VKLGIYFTRVCQIGLISRAFLVVTGVSPIYGQLLFMFLYSTYPVVAVVGFTFADDAVVVDVVAVIDAVVEPLGAEVKEKKRNKKRKEKKRKEKKRRYGYAGSSHTAMT
jgi:hypothetical protein